MLIAQFLQERMTLKHSNMAKWARQQLARGHRDPAVSGEGDGEGRWGGEMGREMGRGRSEVEVARKKGRIEERGGGWRKGRESVLIRHCKPRRAGKLPVAILCYSIPWLGLSGS